MDAKKIMEDAKKVLFQAEARLLDKRNKELVDAIKGIKIEQPRITVNPPQINIPEIKVPPIKLPEFPAQPKQEIVVKQEAPKDIDVSGIEKVLRDGFANFKLPEAKVNVNVPKIEVPKMVWPDDEMPIRGIVSLEGVNLKNPLPVQLRDSDGKPFKFPEFMGGGGGFRHVVIDDILAGSGLNISAGQVSGSADSVNIIQSITLESKQLSGSEDSVIVNNTVDVRQLSGSEFSAVVNNTIDSRQVSGSVDSVNIVSFITLEQKQLSGSIDSVYITGAAASTYAELLNPDGRVKVELPTGSAGLTDTEFRAAHLDVQQLSGSMDSVVSREIPDATSTYAPANATVSAYDNKLVIKASAGVLYAITGYNSSTSAQFIQIHNTAAMPADAGVPAVVFRVPAESSFSISANKFGRYFSIGITVINSSTAPTATKQAADCWYDAQYA